jgi:cyclohexyl-isocyanide hydratase
MSMDQDLHIGALVFTDMDQIDFTGPFEVLSRLPGAKFHVMGKETKPIRDVMGLILTPETSIAEAPSLDLLVVPGGPGQEGLMEDEEVLAYIRAHVEAGRYLFSVCTGALICGAAGVLRGRRATTHWGSLHLLHYFGAEALDERVVVDGRIISAGGVTSGIDGALRVAALLRGDDVARKIQLYMQYAPEPGFNSGHPKTAPAEIVEAARRETLQLTQRREATAMRHARRLGIVAAD